MADMSNVLLSGRLSKDPEVRFTQSGVAVCSASLAVEYLPAKGEKEVSFFDFVVFGKTGEALANSAKKGARVALSGRLRQRSWEQNGAKRYKVEIIADAVFSTGVEGSGPARSAGSASGRGDDSEIPF